VQITPTSGEAWTLTNATEVQATTVPAKKS
jgi:hypothetical protein